MRVVVDAPRGRGDADFVEQLDARAARAALPTGQVRADRLDELPADGVQRIERGQRILEHRADLAAANAAHRALRQVVDAPPGEPNLARRRCVRADR